MPEKKRFRKPDAVKQGRGAAEEEMNLSGKKVLITGGAVRVGAQFCRSFAERGARVVIHCLHSRVEAEVLCAELGGAEAGHSVYVCDLTDLSAARAMIRSEVPDVLVNSAAMYLRRSLPEETESEAETQFAVNFHAPVEMIRELALCGAGKEEISVVNVVDQGIVKTDPASFSYSLSKKLLCEATRSAALAYAPRMRVNALAPGAVIAPKGLEHLGMKKTLPVLPLGRPVSLRDLGDAAVFLASNSSMTGETLFVDCGQQLMPWPR